MESYEGIIGSLLHTPICIQFGADEKNIEGMGQEAYKFLSGRAKGGGEENWGVTQEE